MDSTRSEYGSERSYESQVTKYADILQWSYDHEASDESFHSLLDDVLDGMVMNKAQATDIIYYSDTEPDGWKVRCDPSSHQTLDSLVVWLAYERLYQDVVEEYRSRGDA